jgi:hypothetical protein
MDREWMRAETSVPDREDCVRFGMNSHRFVDLPVGPDERAAHREVARPVCRCVKDSQDGRHGLIL